MSREFSHQGVSQKLMMADILPSGNGSEIPQMRPITIHYPSSRDTLALKLRFLGNTLFSPEDAARDLQGLNTSTLSSVLSDLTSPYQVAAFPEHLNFQVASLDTSQESSIKARANSVVFITGLINALRAYEPGLVNELKGRRLDPNTDQLNTAMTTLQLIAAAAHTQDLEIVLSRAIGGNPGAFTIEDITLLPKEKKGNEVK